ncbi:hypothetical protein [Streptomyces cyaneofuscatus]|uniref:Y-family DNA polymerase n=1 Tax=Streptomyces cyaneofuscatus TaxID=66883 RepID=UPI0033302688
MTGPAGARVVVAWVPDFPVLAYRVADDAPVAVVHRDAVVACSASARAAGVRRRMRVRTALARCHGLRVVERDLAAEVRAFEPVIRRVEEAVLPRLEVIRPGLIAAPAREASRYWGGEIGSTRSRPRPRHAGENVYNLITRVTVIATVLAATALSATTAASTAAEPSYNCQAVLADSINRVAGSGCSDGPADYEGAGSIKDMESGTIWQCTLLTSSPDPDLPGKLDVIGSFGCKQEGADGPVAD